METKWGTGTEEGTLDGGDEVQQGKVEGENGSILWGMVKQVCFCVVVSVHANICTFVCESADVYLP